MRCDGGSWYRYTRCSRLTAVRAMSIARTFRLELGVTRELANPRKYLDALYDGVACRGTLLWRARQSGVMLVLMLRLKDGGGVVSVVCG